MRVLSVDKSTLALPESPGLWEKFGCHKSCHGLGNVSAEICTVFDVAWRVPVLWKVMKATTSEFRLFKPLIAMLKKHSLLLLDNGFYGVRIFEMVIGRQCHFLVPMAISGRPRVLRKLGPGDYLCEIQSTSFRGKKTEPVTLIVRVIYVYRKGFRRRRLVTSLLDPAQYPADELAQMYHQRWHVETFYRDFKIQMEGNVWHCKSVDTFHKELLSKFILITLTRLAMAEAARRLRTPPGNLSFARALACTKSFLCKLTQGNWSLKELYEDLVDQISRNRIRSKPGRSYSRDAQERRKKARGLDRGKVGRPRKNRDQPKPDLTENLAGRLVG